jgi:hypothetical protein
MTGSAFILHNNTWSCSNEVSMGVFSEPIMAGGKVVSIKETNTITLHHPFHLSTPPDTGDKCEIVFLNEVSGEKYAFDGAVKAIGKLHTIINIFAKSNKIQEFLSNITFKN